MSVSRIKRDKDTFTWNEIKENGLPPCDSIINLTGANIIDKRWTEARKKELYDSRIGTNQILIEKAKQSSIPLKHFISPSAVGVYPPSVNENDTYDEFSPLPPNSDNLPFPQKLCRDWEQTIFDASESFKDYPHLNECQLNIVRVGLVVGVDGGLMQQLLPVFKLCLGGRVGSGLQAFPWIHINDLISIFEHLATKGNTTGPNHVEVVNAVAPGIVSQNVFANTLASVLHRPAFFWTPSFVLRWVFQDRAQLLLEGTWVKPVNTLRVLNDFYFEYPQLRPALESLLKK